MESTLTKWYSDWQNRRHASEFDVRHTLDSKNLIRAYEAFNDVRLLNGRLDQSSDISLLEVGCATGEFYRYLRVKYPRVRYYGIDISRAAIARAREKYPEAHFAVSNPDIKITDALRDLRMPEHPEIVYAKDVVHHQTRPFEFVSGLLQLPSEALIMRCRTRDVGETELDPELSCQYHYDGWMPYIVVNLNALIDHILEANPGCEVVVLRNHMILGGQYNRFLPKECYLTETGTAETAVGVFKKTECPGKVSIEDRTDQNPNYSLGYKVRRGLSRVLKIVTRR